MNIPTIPVSELLWLSLDPDEKYIPIGPNSLKDLCTQKLTEDVSLLTVYLPRLPKQIHLIILSSAVAQNRYSSVENIMRYWPYEKIELPVPDVLKSLNTIPIRNQPEIESVYKNFTRVAAEMLSVFFHLIYENSIDSKLRCLDFGFTAVGCSVFSIIERFLGKEPRFFSTQYTLKCAVAVNKSTDLFSLCNWIEKTKAIGLQFVVTGISCYNNYYPDLALMNVFEYLSALICVAARKLSILLAYLNISSACSKEDSTFRSSPKYCKPSVTVGVGASSSSSSFSFSTIVASAMISSKVRVLLVTRSSSTVA